MKKQLIRFSALLLLLLNVACSSRIDNLQPKYVSLDEYKQISCKEIKEMYFSESPSCQRTKEIVYRAPSEYEKISCEELKLKEKLIYISPIEYEKLSCEQLKEQMIKINNRLNAKSRIETEDTISQVAAAPILFVTGMWVMVDYSRLDVKDYEIEGLKRKYEALKKFATQKNCSFVAGM